MSVFLTDPDNPQPREQLKGDSVFKEEFEKELVVLGIPYYYARTATIDLKRLWIPCFHKKLSPKRTANLLFADVKKSYHITDDKTIRQTNTKV